MEPVKIFIAYSHMDVVSKDALCRHLKPLERVMDVIIWHDHHIEAGDDWEKELSNQLKSSDIILVLVSANLIASDYFYSKELKIALERHDRDEAKVVPIILRRCQWEITPLGRLEALPSKGHPVSSWKEDDDAWDDITKNIRELVISYRNKILFKKNQSAYSAIVDAAERSFKNQNWLIAKNEFSHALKLHQAGFNPDRTHLNHRIAACSRQLRLANKKKPIPKRRLPGKVFLEKCSRWFTGIKWQFRLPLRKALTRITDFFRGTNGKRLLGFIVVVMILLLIRACWPFQLNTTPSPIPLNPNIGPRMVSVPTGSFQMGSQDAGGSARFNEKPARLVTVAGFEIAANETTLGDFKAFVEDTHYRTDAEKAGKSNILTGDSLKNTWELRKGIYWRHDEKGRLRPPGEYNYPVLHVSWNDANAYCNWLSEKTGRTYRLPSEAEWEYAARNGSQASDASFAGAEALDEVAWYKQNSNLGVHPVGRKKPNRLGIFDMSGNVWEWCADWYHSSYQNAPNDESPWLLPIGSFRVQRGGSWYSPPSCERVRYRNYEKPTFSSGNTGFRVARLK